MYFLTYSEYYPIYEPAEGGYYYSGKSICYMETATTFRKARLKMRKLLKNNDLETSWISTNKLSFGFTGKYIGEGWICEITRKPVKEYGYTPYC